MQGARLLRFIATLMLGCGMAGTTAGAEEPGGPLVLPFDGTLAIWGGGPMNDHVAGRLKKLVGPRRETVFLTDKAVPRSGEAPRDAHLAGARRLTLDQNVQPDAETIKAIDEAHAVWIDAPAQSVRQLVPALREVLARGGFVGGTLAQLDLLPRVRIEGGEIERDTQAIDRALDAGDLDAAFAVPAETLLVIEGRDVTCVGRAAAAWRLPAPRSAKYGHAGREIVVRPEEEQDLLTIRRASLARREGDVPGDKLRTPEVAHGSLLICGGGDLPDSVWQRLIELAGGPDAKIVFLTASLLDPDAPNPKGLQLLHKNGARVVEVVAARTPQDANSPRFAQALHNARAVWFTGGRQWKYLDAFQGTVAEKMFRDVLARGGVIGGSSAGAAVQAEYMVRGSPLSNRIISAEGYERGLDFLPGTAIDIHVSERGRLEEFVGLISRRPNLLGLALDEKAAVEVHGHQLTVIGPGEARIVDFHAGRSHMIGLRRGERFDLQTRQAIDSEAAQPSGDNR
ncbi:MAG TPA: cyanophycinase [Pirellulales bacterium]|jgi:cyanophycinase